MYILWHVSLLPHMLCLLYIHLFAREGLYISLFSIEKPVLVGLERDTVSPLIPVGSRASGLKCIERLKPFCLLVLLPDHQQYTLHTAAAACTGAARRRKLGDSKRSVAGSAAPWKIRCCAGFSLDNHSKAFGQRFRPRGLGGETPIGVPQRTRPTAIAADPRDRWP